MAVPGTSEHQTGLAVDLDSASYQVLNRKQEQTKEQKWLMEHCWEYGFILRFPSDKSDVTGIGYEPWHYRYVGKETALAMRDSGLCLEEYLTGVKCTGIGDASGIFPIDSDTKDYDQGMVDKFDALIADKGYPWKLRDVLADGAGHGQAQIGVDVDLADSHGSGLAQLLLRDADGVGHLAAELVDLGNEVLGHGGRAVQDDGEASL